MKKCKIYSGVKFSPHVINEAHDKFLSQLNTVEPISKPILVINHGTEMWVLDTKDEFFSEYTISNDYGFTQVVQSNELRINSRNGGVNIEVELPARHLIESVFNIFNNYEEECRIKQHPKPITIFIGHGRDSQWRNLKDHLQDQHSYKVVAYEIGPRAGLSVKEVLNDMLDKSSMAFLVLTGEDIHSDGELHARENVIHELGLFQGRLGFMKAIALLEEGVKEFSNILGINQIRFGKESIREAFGDVVATIKRETNEE